MYNQHIIPISFIIPTVNFFQIFPSTSFPTYHFTDFMENINSQNYYKSDLEIMQIVQIQPQQAVPHQVISSIPEQKQEILKANELFNKNIQDDDDKKKQKFGRNILSNIFHLMTKKIKKQKKTRQMIIKIIQSHGMVIKINEFYNIFKKMSSKLSTYATLRQIKSIWIGNQKFQPNDITSKKINECSKIFRILGKNYLERVHVPYVFNSNKIKRESKRLHVAYIRRIYQL